MKSFSTSRPPRYPSSSSSPCVRRRLGRRGAIVAVLALATCTIGIGAALHITPGNSPIHRRDEPSPTGVHALRWPTDFHAYTGARDFNLGVRDPGIAFKSTEHAGLTLIPGAVEATWTSREYEPSGGFTELVASWQADTPPGSWVEIGMQATTATATSRWYVMGVWAFDSSTVARHSVNGQEDAVGTISTDTFIARDGGESGPALGYRLRVTLHGTPAARPVVRQVAAATSVPGDTATDASSTTMDRTVDLPVPMYSQETHRGEYPAYDGGGEAWCSPTSTAMVMSYYRKDPPGGEVAALPRDPVFDGRGRADGVVDYAAIHTYDSESQGTGNWPFNTAFAAAHGLDSSVRQYSSLQALEDWIKRDVPLVVSIDWNNVDADPTNDLDGAPIGSTPGHLLVIRGFTAAGDVIANDPASPGDASVRHVYDRAQIERNWLRASHGTTYVIAR